MISFATVMFFPTQFTFISFEMYHLSTFIVVDLKVLVIFLKAASDTFEPTDRKTDPLSPVKWLKRIHFSEKKRENKKRPHMSKERKARNEKKTKGIFFFFFVKWVFVGGRF